jgi:hypothetical protein
MNKAIAVLLASLVCFSGCKKSHSPEGDSKSELGAKHGGTPTSREGEMYMLGMKLAQAAMVNGRTDADLVDRTFHAAQVIADITLKEKLEPLPAPTHKSAEDGAAGLHYLLDGEGKTLARAIDTQFGATASATYELALKINMLPTLYVDDPKDTMADTMADVFTRLGHTAKLDKELAPLVDKLKARAPMNDVDDTALDLNKLLPVAIATLYEKDDKKTN